MIIQMRIWGALGASCWAGTRRLCSVRPFTVRRCPAKHMCPRANLQEQGRGGPASRPGALWGCLCRAALLQTEGLGAEGGPAGPSDGFCRQGLGGERPS